MAPKRVAAPGSLSYDVDSREGANRGRPPGRRMLYGWRCGSELTDSEINLRISWPWDGGIDVRLGRGDTALVMRLDGGSVPAYSHMLL
jgi:hypothetical protein